MIFEMDREIYCSMIGGDGRIRNSAIIDLLQDASDLHLKNLPVLADYFREEDCVMFLVSRQVDILRRPVYGEKVRVKTWTYELNRMYGFRNTLIYGADGEVCVQTIAGGAFMDTKSLRPMRVPTELIERVNTFERHDMEYLPRKIAVPKREPDAQVQAVIRSCDIDMNRHVNNARYLDIIEELADGTDAKRLRLEYKIPLKRDDKALIKRYDTEDGCITTIEGEDGIRFFTAQTLKN